MRRVAARNSPRGNLSRPHRRPSAGAPVIWCFGPPRVCSGGSSWIAIPVSYLSTSKATLAIEDSARTGDRMLRKVFAFRPQT